MDDETLNALVDAMRGVNEWTNEERAKAARAALENMGLVVLKKKDLAMLRAMLKVVANDLGG